MCSKQTSLQLILTKGFLLVDLKANESKMMRLVSETSVGNSMSCLRESMPLARTICVVWQCNSPLRVRLEGFEMKGSRQWLAAQRSSSTFFSPIFLQGRAKNNSDFVVLAGLRAWVGYPTISDQSLYETRTYQLFSYIDSHDQYEFSKESRT